MAQALGPNCSFAASFGGWDFVIAYMPAICREHLTWHLLG
jgi:hypothetical protein